MLPKSVGRKEFDGVWLAVSAEMNAHMTTFDTREQERVDYYDENFTHIGQLARTEAHALGAWHRSVHCWVLNGMHGGSVLFQLRTSEASFYPDKLDISAAGHLMVGEGKEGVIREVAEELNVTPSFSELIDLGTKIDVGKFGPIINREFAHVFLWRRDVELSSYRPNLLEVPGLIELPVAEGLRLFSGERPSASCKGIFWNESRREWREREKIVSVGDFVPRIDLYYLRVLVLAQRCLNGEQYLAI